MKPEIRKKFVSWFERSKWASFPLSLQGRIVEAAFRAGFRYGIKFVTGSKQTKPSKTRPPLGIEPQGIWMRKQLDFSIIYQRRLELIQAISRYREANLEPNSLWIKELEFLNQL